MGYGEHHVASPEGRYGSVHSTISDNENAGSLIRDIRVLSSPVFRTHYLGDPEVHCRTRASVSVLVIVSTPVGERRANK
jgi:hypothetical protein